MFKNCSLASGAHFEAIGLRSLCARKMAARNPVRNHFKQGSNARDVKQELRKVTGDCKKEARAALVIRKRNIELQDEGRPQGKMCAGRA